MNRAVLKEMHIGDVVAKASTWNPVRDAADEEITYIDLSAIDNGKKVVNGCQTLTGRDAPSRARQRVQAGDILVSTVRPNLNGVARVPDELDGATASTGFCVLRPRSGKVDPSFLFHWVQSPNFVDDMVGKATGASYPAVSDKIIFQSAIPIPPLEEQKRIAAILDQADELRRKRQRGIDRLNQLGQAIFHEMFGAIDESDAIPFGDVVYFQEGPGVRNWQFRDEGVKLVNVKNIVDGNLDISNTNRHLEPSEAYGKYKHFLLDEGDFVLASSGVTWGKIAEVFPKDLPLCLNTSMIRIRPIGNSLRKSYLRGFIDMGSFRTQIDRIITGSAQPNFGPSHLKQINIPVPNIVEQDRFAERILKLRLCIDQEVNQREFLDKLFSSLQHRAFQGEL